MGFEGEGEEGGGGRGAGGREDEGRDGAREGGEGGGKDARAPRVMPVIVGREREMDGRSWSALSRLSGNGPATGVGTEAPSPIDPSDASGS